MTLANLGATVAELDLRRELDEITSVDFAVESVILWAQGFDEHDTSKNGISHSAIVESLLGNSELRSEAFQRGYNGQIRFPIAYAGPLLYELSDLFGQQIRGPRANTDESLINRVRILQEVIADAVGVEQVDDPRADLYASLARQIIGAHSIYRYLDRRISKKFKAFQQNPGDSSIMPGKEEVFWNSALFGSPNSPGIFDTQGALTRLMQSIADTAHDLYGENADRYLDAWWAAANMIKADGVTFKESFGEPVRALVKGDLGSAIYALKERLYTNPESLPYRSRAKLELDEGETDYFAMLFAELRPKPAESKPVVEVPEILREQLLRQALEHVGVLATWPNTHQQVVTAYIRRVGIDTRANTTDQLVEDVEYPYSVIPYALVLDYFDANRTEAGLTVTRRRGGGLGIQVTIKAFGELLRNDLVEVLDIDDKYLDRSVRSFHVTV